MHHYIVWHNMIMSFTLFLFLGDDDSGASGLVHLANTVDTALQEFNIDGKGCVARSMCKTLYDKDDKSESVIVKTIANSAIK